LMARKATGTTFQSRDHFFAQVSFGGRQRKAVLLPHARDKDEAKQRAGFIAGIVSQIRRAGVDDRVSVLDIITACAEAEESALPDLIKRVDSMCGNEPSKVSRESVFALCRAAMRKLSFRYDGIIPMSELLKKTISGTVGQLRTETAFAVIQQLEQQGEVRCYVEVDPRKIRLPKKTA
jgi:hypothetical protein